MNNNHSEEAPGQNKTKKIIVNGRQREFTGQEINYREVVEMAFPGATFGSDDVYTVAYANPHGKDGTLVDEQKTHVQEGMVFNVTKTHRS